jgi:hypothetical protein
VNLKEVFLSRPTDQFEDQLALAHPVVHYIGAPILQVTRY